ncbi:MAG TPA: LptA/OstA family protein [Verrucomicrobiae bacterium]|nr:LptA/OstA family protein [Verrucomicrobiae bacterium]
MKLFLLALGIAIFPAALNAQTNSNATATNDVIAKLLSDAPSTNSVVSTNIVLRPETTIRSKHFTWNMKTSTMIYTGDVRVDDPKMKLTCDVLTIEIPEHKHPDSMIADHNVVIDAVDNEGKPIHATSDKAIYSYKVENSVTNEIVKLIGNPLVLSDSNPKAGDNIAWSNADIQRLRKEGRLMEMAGDEITWNRVDGQIQVSNPVMTGRQNFIEPSAKPASSVNATNTP